VTPPRASGFGPLSWLWWPVVVAGWSLAAAVMGAEMAIAAPWRPRGGPARDGRGILPPTGGGHGMALAPPCSPYTSDSVEFIRQGKGRA
jgi:hypothetical protein